MRFFRKPPKKQWFRDKDGTFYRNCSLILVEQKQAVGSKHFWPLHEEFQEVFFHGVKRKDKLGPDDIEVRARPFREAYPDKPGLWILDGA